MLGENGTGKTTFVKMLAGKDAEKKDEVSFTFKFFRFLNYLLVISLK
jgi:ATPase subunit of ABC transporter with duplicated ATPase domains